MGKGSNTSTSTTTNKTTSSPDSQAADAYRDLLTRAADVANTPYQSYSGELTAPINAQQTLGIGNINSNAGFAQPYIQQAAGLATAAATPLTAGQIQQYQSPYIQDVVNATQNQFNSQNQQQQQALTSNAIAQGALGGNRTGVAAANLAQAQQTAQAPVIAGLYNNSYQQGINTALSQQAAQAQGAYSLGNLGVAGQTAALSGASAQVGAGTLQQSTQQAQDQALYNQFLLQQAYPFQTTQWLAGIDTGVGSQLGGTTTSVGTGTTEGPSPNSTGQIIGAGLSAASLFLSDRRAKEDIHQIGKTNDGQPIYRFRYKGDPTHHIGLIAQEVEKKHPEAVHSGFGPMKVVDVRAATDDSIKRASGGFVPHFDTGGAAMGDTPFGGIAGYVPTIGITGGRGAPSAANMQAPSLGKQEADGFSDPMSMAKNAAGIAKALKGGFGANEPLSLAPPGISYDQIGVNGGTIGGTGGILGGFYAAGGAVKNFDLGGVVDGFAPNSFDPDVMGSAPASFNDRFSAINTEPDVGLRPIIQPDASYLGGAAPLKEGSFDTTPTSRDVSTETPLPFERPVPGVASVSSNVPLPVQRPLTGAEPISEERDVTQETPTLGYADNINSYGRAISSIESGGRYDVVGPQVPKTGDHAYGRYQVMGANIPQWTEEVLGKQMTPAQFLASPQAQDAVFRAKFGQYVNKYGPEGAARAWFGGEGGMNNPNARDVNGMSVAEYGRRFMTAMGNPRSDQDMQVAGFAPTDNGAIPGNARPTQSIGVAAPEMAGWGILGKLSPGVGQALLAAGAGMMASKSPFLGNSIGEGVKNGLTAYGEAQKAAREDQKNALTSKRLDQMATQQAAKLALDTRRQSETEAYHQDLLAQSKLKYIGNNSDGMPVYLDTKTGKEIVGQNRLLGKAPPGYVANPDGTMSPVKGGPADPNIIKGISDAKRGTPMDEDTADFLANRVLAGDSRALVGLGRGSQGAENIAKIQKLVAQKAASQGMDARDILAKVAEQSGLTAQQRTFGTQTARMAVNTTEAQGAIELGRQASANLPRGNWVPLNRLIQRGQVIASNPALAKFGAANLAIINTYARAISPTGVPTVHDKEHAEQMLSTAMGPEAYNAVLDQMTAEINIAHSAAPKAKAELEALRKSQTGGSEASSSHAPVVVPARPAGVPEGSAYSPSRKMWRDPNGRLFNAEGQAVNP